MLIRSGKFSTSSFLSVVANSGSTRNDILRKHGVIPEKPPSPTAIIQEAILEARKQAHEDRLKDRDLDELNELEDEEDEAFLEKYRWVLSPDFVKRLLF